MTPAPLLLLGAPYSGLAQTAGALGRHPRLVPLPELRLTHAERVGSLLALFEHCEDRAADGLLRAVATLILRETGDTGIRSAQRWLQRRAEWSTGALLDALLGAVAPRVAVLHDSNAPYRAVEIQRLLGMLPEASLVHLWCSPEAFSRRAGNDWQARLFRPPDALDHSAEFPRLAPALLWYRINHTLLEALDAAPPSLRRQRLQCERVTAQPARVLGALLAEHGVAVSDDQMAAMRLPGGGPFACLGPALAGFGDEPGYLRAPARWPEAPQDAPDDPALAHADIQALCHRLNDYRAAA